MPHLFTRVVFVSALFALSGCGKSEGPDITFERDSAAADDAGADADRTDAGADLAAADLGPPDVPDLPPDMVEVPCNGNPCGPGEECRNDVCTLTSSCGSALDLGILPLNAPQTVTGSLVTEGVADLEASCANPASLRDRVIAFEVEVESTIDYSVSWNGQYDGVIELRSDCDDVQSAVGCFDAEAGQFQVAPGRYSLVLDQVLGNAGAFEVTLVARAARCTLGTNVCMGDALQICPSVQAPETVTCAETCTNGACVGDRCTDAILLGGGGTYSGDGRAYTSALNFQSNVNCTDLGDPGSAIATPGFEVIFYLPGLIAGQVVAVDAQTNDSNVNAVFIMQMCGDTATCAAAYKLTEQPDWVVTADGDYFVVIDKRQSTNTPFNYFVDVL